MARYRGPKGKIARRFKEPIFGPSKALDRRKYGPGQHGRGRKKISDYAVQLQEKQKAKYTYGVLEKQFRNTFDKAAKKKGVTGEVFLQMLESRLDNTVFRMGFAPTRRAARQLVSHKHVMVNGVVTNIASCMLKPGDEVTIREKSRNIELVNQNLGRGPRFSWLEVHADQHRGVFLNNPNREEIPETINEQLIVELYSK
ncbi:MAG: 30S ribosomal protein S4 [Bacteroidetes bacterium]|nr:30S ribosomal protein S4 [Bacteroidota bacterium]MCB0841692.1 30S ribosomal protein S4 [Bacteroidota bacterium]MCB0855137.1 30S ribosomal protein S4 [Bacteroidota bacterium]